MGYHGEVNVAQEQLNSFLSVAEDLQVKGLTQNKDDMSSHTNHQEDTLKSIPRPPRPNKSSLPGKYQAGVQDVIKQETASQVVGLVQDAEQSQHDYQAHSEAQPVEEYEEVEYTGEQAGYEVDTFADNPEYTCADTAVVSLLIHQSLDAIPVQVVGKLR